MTEARSASSDRLSGHPAGDFSENSASLSADRERGCLTRGLEIGGITFRNGILLAPMSGVSDVPFRQAAWKCGAGMVVSEMVASEALVTGKEEMRLKAEGAGLPVHMVQLAGREAVWMDRAARMARDNGAAIIDINMGCPARRVTTGYSGSALMRDLDHATTLIEAVVAAVDVPVTLKMRLGWDADSINAPELARRAERAGIAMLTVHGRTRCQFYKGNADWHAIAAVRDAVDLPLVVNGDIQTLDDAIIALNASGADAVMIGRASYGAPDLPGRIAIAAGADTHAISYDPAAHYEAMLNFYGTEAGLRCARKHVGWLFERIERESHLVIPGEEKRAIQTSIDPGHVLKRIDALWSSHLYREAHAA